MMTNEGKLQYVLGFLEASVGSDRKLTADELRSRMRFLVAVINEEPNPTSHLIEESSETTRAANEPIH